MDMYLSLEATPTKRTAPDTESLASFPQGERRRLRSWLIYCNKLFDFTDH